MAYTNIDLPTDYFNTKLYTGTGSSNSLTGVGFQPDWVWIKKRNGAVGHRLYDAVRGVQNTLFSQDTAVEATGQSTTLTAFNSDGFTVISESGVNASGDTYVAWNWLGANTTVSNNSGSITSTVSANTTAGFSIVGYTGNATAGATVGHGLGAVPKMIILKRRTGSAEDWYVYHGSLANTEVLRLNLNNAKATRADFNNTTPTSTVFTINSTDNVNASGSTFIAYCFADVKGYSKFGSYAGTGSTSATPFIYTGFKPAFILTKNITVADDWTLSDITRDNAVGGGGNGTGARLLANTSAAEDTNTIWASIQKYSNGFSPQGNDNVTNASGSTYIYMALAQNPFVTSGGIPVTAR
jgi:hypothetical protein